MSTIHSGRSTTVLAWVRPERDGHPRYWRPVAERYESCDGKVTYRSALPMGILEWVPIPSTRKAEAATIHVATLVAVGARPPDPTPPGKKGPNREERMEMLARCRESVERWCSAQTQ